MPVTYITDDGELAQPSESERPLHTYQPRIKNQIGVEVIGLTGKGNQIRRLVVPEELSDSEQSDIEDWLGVSLALDKDDADQS